MAIPELVIEEALKALIGLAVQGITALVGIRAQTKTQLVKVYQEIKRNRFILDQSGLLETHGIAIDDKSFISVAENLDNKEISPLYRFNKRGVFFPDRKKAVARRKTQYAINYIVEQIGNLKDLTKVKKNRNAKSVRLLTRLRTLDKHLSQLEKALRPFDSKSKLEKK